MAKLPDQYSLGRVTAPAGSGGVRAAQLSNGPALNFGSGLDYSKQAQAGQAIGQGIQKAGAALQVAFDAEQNKDDFETEKRLIDFRLETENDLETRRRAMEPGGAGFTEDWGIDYDRRARSFMESVPEQTRQKADLALVRHHATLSERAHGLRQSESDRYTMEGLQTTLGKQVAVVDSDPTRREQQIQEGVALIEKAPLTQADRAKARQDYSEQIDITAVRSKINAATRGDDYKQLETELAPNQKTGRDRTKTLTSGKARRKAAGWTRKDTRWQGLNQYQKAAAMALMEADGRNIDNARNALAAMINRASKGGEDLGAHVSGSIYQPTIEPSQQARFASILNDAKFEELTKWAERRAKGEEPDIVHGATHFLASEGTMLALEAKNPRKYRSWRKWTGFNGKAYNGVLMRDKSHAFLAPEGKAEAATGDGYKGPYKNLTVAQRHTLWNEASRKRKTEIDATAKVIKEYETTAVAGYAMPEAQELALGARVEELDDPALMAVYKKTLGTATIMREMAKMTPRQIEAYIGETRNKFAESTPEPHQLEMLEKVETLASKQQSMLKDDALTWARRSGAVPVQALDFNDDASMSQRLEHAEESAKTFGTPMQYFTKPDREVFASSMKQGGEVLIGLAERMISTWGNEHTVAAVGEIEKDAPEAVRAAWLLAAGGDKQTARDIAQTLQRRQDPNYRPSRPSRTNTASVVTSTLKDTYSRFAPEVVDAVINAADAVYEARASHEESFNEDIYKQALNSVVGETTNSQGLKFGGIVASRDGWMSNDRHIILPPNVRQDLWLEVFEEVTPEDLATSGLKAPTDGNGKPISMTRVMSGQIVQIADGQYTVALGDVDEPGNEQWVMSEGSEASEPKPFVFDLKRLEPVLRRRRPDLFN